MTGTATVDIAGAQMGGAARYAAELRSYLTRTGRRDIHVIGGGQHVGPAWLLRRESFGRPGTGRRIAVNNVSFAGPGGPRWVLLRNALHFLAETEEAELEPGLRRSVGREGMVVRLAVRRADVVVVPCTAMAERVLRILPGIRSRLVARPHPVSPTVMSLAERRSAILCPVLFAPYKRMDARLAELLAAVDEHGDPEVQVRVTAAPADLPPSVASHPRLECLGRLDHRDLRTAWAQARAVYFPTGLESFGYPLAEARVNGQPVIARDTAQNLEVGGAALCGYQPGDPDSLRQAVKSALTADLTPDPAPFDPDAYFGWLLGSS